MKIHLAKMSPALLLAALACLMAETGHAAAASTWTKGHRKILVIPIRFTDAAGPSDAVDPNGVSGWGRFTNGTTQAENNNFFLQQSYGQFSMDFTVLPEIHMGVSQLYYTNNLPGTPFSKWTEWGSPGSLADDARAKARAIGLTNGFAALYESANYDLDIIACGYIAGHAGASSDGGRAVIAHNFNALPHEIGHCLGLQHANGYSRPSYYSPVTRGSFPFSYFYDPYGDVFCLMGYKDFTTTTNPPPNRDLNPYFKYELGWLTDTHITTPAGTSGTYRIHAFDQGSLDADKKYALRIARDSSYTYWFDLRQAVTNLPDAKWSQNGLEVRFGAEKPRASSGVTVLIDMTPDSRGPTNTSYATMRDAPLLIGRTYSDAEANIHVTPIRKGGTTPESLDVVVNFGPFPTNQTPTLSISPATVSLSSNITQTFTATASDPDGDPLAYYWEFDDATKSGGMDFGGLGADSLSATQAVHAWTQKGEWFVRCTATDMKGRSRTASALVSVTNGTAAILTISGTVTDELGNPVEGAIVNNNRSGVSFGATNFAGSSATAADGNYRLRVPSPTYKYVLSAVNLGWHFTNTLGGTVTVANASVSNVNFTRVRTTRAVSGGIYVAGRGYNAATDGPLTVSDGTQSTNVAGGGWQLNIPDGSLVTLTATASNPAYTVSSDFPKPYSVVDDVNTMAFFVDIPGAMPLTGFTTNAATSDDTAGTVNIPVVMTLPPGLTNWPGNQAFAYTIDNASTADYGTDYKMHGGNITFYGGYTSTTYNIPLTLLHDGIPKTKTIIINLIAGNSIANPGPITTFTYTIHNPVPATTLANATLTANSITFTITNLTPTATNHILRTHDLLAPLWTTAHTFTAATGTTNWTEPLTNDWPRVFYRIRSD